MRLIIVVLLAMITAFPAAAQTAQTQSPIRDAVDAAYALGLQTGQSVTGMLKEQDDRLKWVLDNWVPRQPEMAK